MNRLEHEGCMVQNGQVEDFKVSPWFGVLNKLPGDICLGISFISRYVRGIFPSLHKITLKYKSVNKSALGRKNHSSSNPIVTNEVCHVSESPSMHQIHAARQMVIPPRSK